MRSEWREVVLGDVAQFIDYRGKTPPKKTHGIPLVTAKIIKNNSIQEPQEFIAVDYYDTWMTRGIPQKGDVVFTTEAPLGEVAIIKTSDKLAFAQRLIVLQGDRNVLDNTFLFYLLQYSPVKGRIEARSSGTTVFGIKNAELKKIILELPSLPVQQSIASTLSCLDDKIELNNKINANLEAQAQAIFKSWFVDFEPFQDGGLVESELGLIPRDWRVGILSDLVQVKYGKDHKKLADGNIPVYGSGGIMRYAEKPLYTSESVLIPRKGTLSNVIYLNEPFWSVDTMFYTEMKFSHIAKYIYFFICSQDLLSMNAGTAVPSMTTDILNNLLIRIPPHAILKEFNRVVSPLFETLKHNDIESRTLAALRDTLLPKLMSGEIEVPIE